MLASRIRAELPEIDIVANLSWFDVKDSIRTDWDILVSTIPLPLPADDYILVNPLLDTAGLKAIRDFLSRRQGSIRSQSRYGRAEHGRRGGGGLVGTFSERQPRPASVERMVRFEAMRLTRAIERARAPPRFAA